MSTSGTFDFTMEIVDVVDEAFERCRVDIETLTTRHLVSAARSLSLMQIEWENRGVKEWKIARVPITTEIGMMNITLDPQVITVVNAFYRNMYGVDTPMKKIGRIDYDALPDKTVQGNIPDRFFLDRQRVSPILNIYTACANAGEFIMLDCFVATEDVGSFSNNPDAPRRWLEATCAGLAARLGEKYAPELEEGLIAKAQLQFKYARDEERDDSSTQITANYGGQTTASW